MTHVYNIIRTAFIYQKKTVLVSKICTNNPNTGVAQTKNLYNFITMDTILKTFYLYSKVLCLKFTKYLIIFF